MIKNTTLGFFLIALQASALAQTSTVYACINESAAGLNWDGARWVTTSYKAAGKFLMTVRREPEKVYMELKGDGVSINCMIAFNLDDNPFVGDLKGLRACSTFVGESVYFSEKEQRGGISHLNGAASVTNTRDSLVVMPFICQKF